MKNLKNTLFITLIISLMLSCSQKQNNKETSNDLIRDELMGSVKSIKVVSYSAEEVFGEVVRKSDLALSNTFNYKKTFNKKGYIIEKVGYKSNGEKDYKFIYKHDKFNNKIKQTYFSPFDKVKSITLFKYDSDNNRVEEKVCNSNLTIKEKKIYKYNKDNLRTEYIKIDDKGSIKYKTTYKFDENGNKIESIYYDSDGKISSKTVRKYDSNNNKLEVKEYTSNGKLESKVVNTFNGNNKKIESLEYDNDGEIEKTKFTYDKEGFLAESVESYSDGSGYNRKEYDKNGNELSSIFYDHDGSISTTNEFKYDHLGNRTFWSSKYKNSQPKIVRSDFEYDKVGNWVKKLTYRNGKISYVAEREIEYY